MELFRARLQLAAGLLRFSAAGRVKPLARVDLPAVERGPDFLRSRLTVVQASEVGRYVRLCAAYSG